MDENDPIQRLSLRYKCPYCMAYPGEHCITVSGSRATKIHSHRTNPLRWAWLAGFREGNKNKFQAAVSTQPTNMVAGQAAV